MKKQKKQTRRMHYVPAFILAEFTDGRTRDSMLTVFEPRTERCFSNKAGNVSLKRDFYIVEPDEEHPGRNPQQIEEFLADFEGSCASTVRAVADTKRLPDPNTSGVDQLLWLAALMRARTPRARRIWSDLTARDLEDHARKIVATPETWAEALRVIPGLSTSGIEDWTYEKAKDHFEHLRVTASGQNWYTKLLMDDARTYHTLFGKKRWTLFVANDDSPDFITSDFPGFLQWFPPNIARPLPADGDLLNDFRWPTIFRSPVAVLLLVCSRQRRSEGLSALRSPCPAQWWER
jgi:Protein of unknown function (DUF4238)